MTLVDYPLFSGVVVIHSLHVSSFREAHNQEFIFPCTVSLWYSVFPGTEHVGEREGYSKRLNTMPEADCTGKMNS